MSGCLLVSAAGRDMRVPFVSIVLQREFTQSSIAVGEAVFRWAKKRNITRRAACFATCSCRTRRARRRARSGKPEAGARRGGNVRMRADALAGASNWLLKHIAETLAAPYNADYRRCPGRRDLGSYTIQLGRRRYCGRPGLVPVFCYLSFLAGSLPASSVFFIVRPQIVKEAPDRGHRRYGVKDFKNDAHRHHSLRGSATRTRTPPASCILR